MNLILILMLITFNFWFSNSMDLFPRSLSEINIDKKLLIMGFGGYKNKSYDVNGDKELQIYFKKYYDNFNMPSSLYLTPSINYNNGTKNLKVNISCAAVENEVESYSIFSCTIENKNENNSIELIQLNDFNFRNETGHINISENEIELSYLAETTKNNIQVQYESLDFKIFELIKRDINKNQVLLYGYLKSNSQKNLSESDWKLYLSEKNFTCEYYHNYTQDKNSQDVISFSPDKNINDNFNGKIVNSTDEKFFILIFSNGTDDSILYSKEEITYVELLGFGNYEKQTNENARNLVYFLGTANNLKQYVRFTAKIINTTSSSLRALQEIYVNATGNLIFIDLETGLAIYNVSYDGTKGMTGNLLIMSEGDYKFSNYKNNFNSNDVTVIIIGRNINLTNTNPLVVEFINPLSEKPTISGNSFSFNMRFPNTTQKLNITDKQTMYLDYYNFKNFKRDEIDCSIENKTNHFTILCEPKKDVYTQFKTLIMKIPNLPSRRLRFLQTDVNSTYLAPLNANGDIQFEYKPEFNTFARKASKKKGLSGGAIAAIVLATVAAVAAIGIAMFFLNRGQVNPIKTSTEMNLPNSTTNINN